jgi:four helix bundle protein
MPVAVRSYRDLVAWRKAMDTVELVYRASERFPTSEMYGLTSQIRRAAVSIPSNIAEGQGRRGTKDLLKCLFIAYGFLLEVETQTQISERLGYLSHDDCNRLLDATAEVGRLLNGLMNSPSTDH